MNNREHKKRFYLFCLEIQWHFLANRLSHGIKWFECNYNANTPCNMRRRKLYSVILNNL